jgi:hypothetical protein
MNSLPQRKLTRVLIAACAALAAIIALEITHPFVAPAHERAAPGARSVVPSSAALPQFTARPLAAFDQILARPLFFEDRRMPVMPEVVPEAEQLEPLHLSLEGVAIGGGTRVAVLLDERERGQIRLAEGMSHNGWTLESVTSAGAEFRRGEDVTRLELDNGDDPRRRRR